MQEMQVQSLGRGDILREEMGTHSNILARKVLWKEEPSGLQSTGSQESDMTVDGHTHILFIFIFQYKQCYINSKYMAIIQL